MEPNLLREIAARLERIESRLDALEGSSASDRNPQPIAFDSPVVGTTEQLIMAPDRPMNADIPAPSNAAARSIPEKPAATIVDEFVLGGRVLPIVGGIVFLLGLAYLVGLGITRGWINREVQFFGALSLSLAFVILGLWKRNEREEFGQVLTGVGFCGLYLTAAGGHVHHQLYGSNVLVASFVGISALNFLYSIWRKSRAFLFLGVLGGLAGALMPMEEQRIALSATLHLLVFATASAIAARHFWYRMMVYSWIAASISLLVILFSPHDIGIRLWLAALHTSIAAIAMTWSMDFRSNGDDVHVGTPIVVQIFGSIMLLGVGLDGTLQKQFISLWGGVHPFVVLQSALIALAAMPLPKQIGRSRLFQGAIVSAAVFAPMQGTPIQAAWIFATLSAVAAAYAIWRSEKWTSILTFVLVVEGLLALLAQSYEPSYPQIQSDAMSALCLTMTGAILLGAVSWGRLIGRDYGLAGILLAIPTLVGTLNNSLEIYDAKILFSPSLAVFIAALIFAGYSARAKDLHAMALMWTCVIAGQVLFAPAYAELKTITTLHITTLVLGMIAVLIAGWNSRILSEYLSRELAKCAFATTCAFQIAASIYAVLLTETQLGIPLCQAICSGIVLVPVALWSFLRPALGNIAAAMMGLYVCGAAILSSNFRFQPFLEILVMALYAISSFLAFFGLGKAGGDIQRGHAAGALLAWGPITAIGIVLLHKLSDWLSFHGAYTVSWTIYAAVIMAFGIFQHSKQFRFAALFMFGTTIFKVFMNDLAHLDPVIRIGALLLLGSVLITAGYGYVRYFRSESK